MRTGCFCNPAACQRFLNLSEEDVENNYQVYDISPFYFKKMQITSLKLNINTDILRTLYMYFSLATNVATKLTSFEVGLREQYEFLLVTCHIEAMFFVLSI